MDDLLREAMQIRPELTRSAPGGERRGALHQGGARALYPSVGLIGSAGFAPAAYQTMPGRYGAIGVNVKIPIFNGGLFKARQTEAELKAKAAHAERQRTWRIG